MEASQDPARHWNDRSGTTFTHPLDLDRFTRAVARDARILDYGCGQGRLCGELIAAGFSNVIGVDFSPEMIRAARERLPAATFTVNDGHSLPYADSGFDAVLLFAVLTCIPDDRAQLDLVREIRRVLRPGGLLLISDYPLQADPRNVARYAQFAQEPGGFGTFRLPDGVALRHHRPEWFEQLLADFGVEHSSEIQTMTMNGNPARVIQLWARNPVRPD
jgi:SAM-dependent methyltransferase